MEAGRPAAADHGGGTRGSPPPGALGRECRTVLSCLSGGRPERGSGRAPAARRVAKPTPDRPSDACAVARGAVAGSNPSPVKAMAPRSATAPRTELKPEQQCPRAAATNRRPTNSACATDRCCWRSRPSVAVPKPPPPADGRRASRAGRRGRCGRGPQRLHDQRGGIDVGVTAARRRTTGSRRRRTGCDEERTAAAGAPPGSGQREDGERLAEHVAEVAEGGPVGEAPDCVCNPRRRASRSTPPKVRGDPPT